MQTIKMQISLYLSNSPFRLNCRNFSGYSNQCLLLEMVLVVAFVLYYNPSLLICTSGMRKPLALWSPTCSEGDNLYCQ